MARSWKLFRSTSSCGEKSSHTYPEQPCPENCPLETNYHWDATRKVGSKVSSGVFTAVSLGGVWCQVLFKAGDTEAHQEKLQSEGLVILTAKPLLF